MSIGFATFVQLFLLALLATTAAGTVLVADTFVGFGHSVTVATVLITSRALCNSGAVGVL